MPPRRLAQVIHEPISPTVPRILSISRNPSLLARRNDALALSGYAVASPKEPIDGMHLLEQEAFDAVIIDDSVEPEARDSLIPALRKVRPGIPILFVYAESIDVKEPLADVTVDVTAGPVPLVRALNNRLRRIGQD